MQAGLTRPNNDDMVAKSFKKNGCQAGANIQKPGFPGSKKPAIILDFPPKADEVVVTKAIPAACLEIVQGRPAR